MLRSPRTLSKMYLLLFYIYGFLPCNQVTEAFVLSSLPHYVDGILIPLPLTYLLRPAFIIRYHMTWPL